MLEELLTSKDNRISLLIRHSNRYDIPQGEDGTEVMLTEQGKTNAYSLGKKLLKYRLNKIVTTSVKRCIQTAECIAKGYGQNIDIEPSSKFGGLHIIDWELANKFLSKKNGYENWYSNILSNIAVPGIHSTAEYKELMTNFMMEHTSKEGLTIFVSHDFLIAFYHYALNKTIYTMFSDWVDYLSGIILKDGEYVARFQNN